MIFIVRIKLNFNLSVYSVKNQLIAQNEFQ